MSPCVDYDAYFKDSYLYGPIAAGADVVWTIFLMRADMFS